MRKEILLFTSLLIGAFAAGQIFQPSTVSAGTGEAHIVAVVEDQALGKLGTVQVTAEKGEGNVYVETDPFVKTNTQASAKKAARAADRYTEANLNQYDLTYEFNISSQVVGGPSAGAAMTLATIAAVTGKSVKDTVAVTGTVDTDGKIGKVGEVPVKAKAAGRRGIETFLVPEGQSLKVNYRRVVDTESRGFLVYRDVEYRRSVFNISDYTMERFGMRTREVRNIGEAAEIAFTG